MTPTERLADFARRNPTRLVDAGGVPWRYIAAGAGPALVLLHGMAGSAEIWFQQIDDLAAERTVIAVTYPEVTSLAELRHGVDAVLAAEGIERYAVVGSSLGGYLAQYLVATESSRITAAVFANTFPPNEEIAASTRRPIALARALPNIALAAYLRRSVDRSLVPAGDGSELLRHLLVEQFQGSEVKRRFLSRYRCVIDPFEPPTPAIPVTIFESDNDPLVPAALRRALRETYPEAAVGVFAGAGHFPYVNRPADYAAAIRAATAT